MRNGSFIICTVLVAHVCAASSSSQSCKGDPSYPPDAWSCIASVARVCSDTAGVQLPEVLVQLVDVNGGVALAGDELLVVFTILGTPKTPNETIIWRSCMPRELLFEGVIHRPYDQTEAPANGGSIDLSNPNRMYVALWWASKAYPSPAVVVYKTRIRSATPLGTAIAWHHQGMHSRLDYLVWRDEITSLIVGQSAQ